MRGYKALNKDMRAKYGNRMQYEPGKTYSVDAAVIPYESGFHFCDRIENLNRFCRIAESRIFEVEAEGEIAQDGDVYAAECITLVRELTGQEVNDYFERNQEELVRSGKGYVRKAAAEQGYGLDILVHDMDQGVRRAVARRGYGLDILIHDESWLVRAAVAEQGYGLDTLRHDGHWYVRGAADQCPCAISVSHDADAGKMAWEVLEAGRK